MKLFVRCQLIVNSAAVNRMIALLPAVELPGIPGPGGRSKACMRLLIGDLPLPDCGSGTMLPTNLAWRG